MKKIIVFAGTNSRESINKKLATYASGFVDNVSIDILDLNDFEMPLFGVDLEKEKGIPENAHKFLDLIKASDGIIVSLAEHNGAYSTAFKNIFDWMSRIDGKLWNNKPMLLMATSPGARGGASVLEIAKSRFPFMGGNIVSEFSLPSFGENFKEGKIVDPGLYSSLLKAITEFRNNL
ncbi:NADPH-dependent FMN reductase [Mariniflexile sp. HMF6888]|uniref:NADPH-dependent FMN reductase n=1 Tax=Mariniflexile sp. HMF6888 TaxID=3373086 RepID=UPI0037A3F026